MALDSASCLVLLELTSQLCHPRLVSLANVFASGKHRAIVTKVNSHCNLSTTPQYSSACMTLCVQCTYEAVMADFALLMIILLQNSMLPTMPNVTPCPAVTDLQG